MSIRPWALALLCLLISPPLEAASHTWSGAVDGTWSNPGNWSAGGPPANGESDVVLTFPLVASNKIMNNDVTVQNFNAIDLAGGYVLYGNTLPMSGSIGMSAPSLLRAHVAAPITLLSMLTTPMQSGTSLLLGGVISGNYGIKMTSIGGPSGFLTLQGANVYTGVTLVESGILAAYSNQALGAGDGLPATGTVLTPSASFLVLATIPNEHLSLGGSFIAEHSSTTWGGPIVLTADTLVGCANLGRWLVTGDITGDFGLSITGSGTPDANVLGGTNTYTGDTTFNGPVDVVGSAASSTFRGPLYSSGTARLRLSPGAAIGRFEMGLAQVTHELGIVGVTAGTGFLTNGLLLNNAHGKLSIRIQSAVLADRFAVGGTVDITSATLAVDSSAFDPAAGTSYVIVANDGTDAIVDTFADLPEGWIFTANARNYRISYVGGDGNDITLTRVVGTPVELQTFSAE